MHNNLNEVPIFLCCLRSGLLIGILYDIFRLPRRIRNMLAVWAADLLFGLTACGLAAATLYICDSGRLRAFSVFGLMLGAAAWQLLPGRLLRSCAARVGLSLRAGRAERRERKRRGA